MSRSDYGDSPDIRGTQVWQEARALVNEIYLASNLRPFALDRDLNSQIRRLTRKKFDDLLEQTKQLSRRIAAFIRYLETCLMKTRVRKL